MVRSGHYRKRSRSRSITPDHKRNKSSRDYDKDRNRRRSRSRDRLRRSRSRDRKKKISESRVRSKPLKLKHRSRSRSKSKEKVVKKDEKKDVKEDEPFDPTNLDKVPGEDEEWVVTDVAEEGPVEDNGELHEEYDYEADEDDRYSRRSSSSHNSHRSSSSLDITDGKSPIATENNTLEDSVSGEKNITNTNSGSEVNDATVEKETCNQETTAKENENAHPRENNKVKEVVLKIKESSAHHRTTIKSLSDKHETAQNKKRSDTDQRGSFHFKHSEDVERHLKDQIRQTMRYERELHHLRIKNEMDRHKSELEVLNLQLEYWKTKTEMKHV